jgi:hypothetical protein
VLLGVISFSGMSGAAAATDCMSLQLQLMWITGFEISCYGSTFNSSLIDKMIFTAGAYSMALTRRD